MTGRQTPGVVVLAALAVTLGTIALADDGGLLVAVHDAAKDSPSGAVTLLDSGTFAVLGTVAVKGDPAYVFQDPSGKSLVVGVSPRSPQRGKPVGPWSVSLLDVEARANALSVDIGFPPFLVATDASRSRQYILGTGAATGASREGAETTGSTLTVLDLAKRQVAASVKTAPGATGLRLSPSGRRLHVLYGGDARERKGLAGKLVVLDTEAVTVLKENDLAPGAFAMEIGPDDKSLYVLSNGGKPKKAARQPALCVVDVETGDVIARLDVGSEMLGLTVDRKRQLVYALGSDTRGEEGLAVIQGTEIKGWVTLEIGHHGIRFAPDDDAVLVLGWESIYQIDPSKPAVARTWPLDFQPAEILFDAPRKRAYVNARTGPEVAEIDLAEGKVLASHKTGSKGKKAGIAIGSALLGVTTGAFVYGWSVTDMVLGPDGRFLYVTNAYTNDLTIVDTSTHQIAGILSTGGGTRKAMLCATGEYLYVEATEKLSRVGTAANRIVGEVPVIVEGKARGAVTYDLPNQRAFIPRGSVVDVLDLGSGKTTKSIALSLPVSAVITPRASTGGQPRPPEPAPPPPPPAE